jgi:hypothetical protein
MNRVNIHPCHWISGRAAVVAVREADARIERKRRILARLGMMRLKLGRKPMQREVCAAG